MKKIVLCVLLAAVLALMPFAGMAADQPVVMLAGYEMKPGDVLHCNGTKVGFSVENPTGYAEVSADGKTLTLHNFDNNGFCSETEEFDEGAESALIVYSPVTLNLQGQNRLSNPYGAGEGITMYGDTTIQGTGSLEINADHGILYLGAGSNLTITSGDLTIKGESTNITADNITITGGKVDLTSDRRGMYAYYDMTISGGEVNIKGEYAMVAMGEMQLTGGKITLEYKQVAMSADPINCTLPIPEGVEIRRIIYASTDLMDYTEDLDQFNSDQWNPQWRKLQLPAQTAEPDVPTDHDAPAAPSAPSVPTTGDDANITLWAALAVMSAAAMMVIRRKRTV